jgi:hypothetical protein
MIYSDGTFTTATQIGPAIISRDEVTLSIITTLTMMQTAADWVPRARDSLGPGFGLSYLVEETAPTHVGGGLVTWDRIYCEIPEDRTEYESYVHPYQFLQGDSTILEIPIPLTSSIEYSYVKTTTPDTIDILRAYLLVQNGIYLYSLGTDPGEANPIIATDTTVSRWRGNIYEVKTRYVPKFTPESL